MSSSLFVGVWALVSVESMTTGGEVSHPFGAAAGYLIYTGDGHMSVAIMHADRRNFTAPDIQAASVEEKLAAFDTYLSYSGTFEVKNDRVVHHVEISLFPNWVGADQVRFFEFSGDQLTLRTPPMVVQGVEQTTSLIWRRAQAIRG